MIHFEPGEIFNVFMWIIRASTVVLAVGWLRKRVLSI
jgi:hypothetical protein